MTMDQSKVHFAPTREKPCFCKHASNAFSTPLPSATFAGKPGVAAVILQGNAAGLPLWQCRVDQLHSSLSKLERPGLSSRVQCLSTTDASDGWALLTRISPSFLNRSLRQGSEPLRTRSSHCQRPLVCTFRPSLGQNELSSLKIMGTAQTVLRVV
jgi:hypothetical protein